MRSYFELRTLAQLHYQDVVSGILKRRAIRKMQASRRPAYRRAQAGEAPCWGIWIVE